MTPSQIIMADAKKNGRDPKVALLTVHEMMVRKLGFILHSGKSVLALVNLGNEKYETHLYSVDSPLRLSHAMVKFYNDLKKLHVQAIYGQADNPQIINLLKSLAKHEHTEVLDPDKPNYNWMIAL